MNEYQPPEPAPEAGSSSTTGSSPVSRRARRRLGWFMVFCALVAYTLDQLTKWWVVDTMREGQITPVLPPLLNWHFIRNPGAAFSIGTDYTWVFTIIMVAVAVALVLQVHKVASWGWSVALGLLLGGASGNLTDRLLREPSFGQGHVVDFIALPNFAIFNIADSAIVCGVVLICIHTLRGVGLDGRRATEEPAGAIEGKEPAPADGPKPANESSSTVDGTSDLPADREEGNPHDPR